MDCKKIKTHWLFLYITQKNKHPFVPILTFILGAWMGMLISPVIGAFLIGLSLYLALVIYFPWDKISKIKNKGIRDYLVPAIITILIVLPFWNKLVSIFPITDPYKQPLRTGTATVEVIVDSNENSQGGCYTGRCAFIVLAKGRDMLLYMNAPSSHHKQIGDNKIECWATAFNLEPSILTGQPVGCITEANQVVIHISGLPQNKNIIEGAVVLTFNSSVTIPIPIPPQKTSENIIISDVQKYLKEGKWP